MNFREGLPDIHIAAGSDPLLFITRMVSLAESKTQMTVELHQDSFGKEGLHFANFFLLVISENLRSGGQLIVRSDEARVQVEMHSTTWESGHPTRGEYIAFCKEIFGPLLRDYNSAFGTHHRMRITRPASGYQLPPQSKRLFEQFSILANTRSLHPLDWERFYLFVRNSRREMPEGTLRPLLVQKGFSRGKRTDAQRFVSSSVAVQAAEVLGGTGPSSRRRHGILTGILHKHI